MMQARDEEDKLSPRRSEHVEYRASSAKNRNHANCERFRFQHHHLILIFVLFPMVKGFVPFKGIAGIRTLGYQNNFKLINTFYSKSRHEYRDARRLFESDSTENVRNLPTDIAELNRILEERAAANRKEQEQRRARRPSPPRRPDVRMPIPVAISDDDDLWKRLPANLQARYQPIRVLGIGAFGEVVLVSDTEIGDEGDNATCAVAAVKIVRARAGGEEPLLLREGVVLSLLPGPPHSPRCIDFGVGRGACYFVFE
jgi:hypothetical protein